MDVTLLNRLREDLSILQGLGAQTVQEFSDLAFKSIAQKLSSNIYSSAAQKLRLDPKAIENAVMGLAMFFFEAARYQVTDEQFLDNIVQVGLDESALPSILRSYRNCERSICEALESSCSGLPRFKGLQWRLESQLGSRSLRGGLEPRVTLRLDMERSGQRECVALISDIPNIVRWSHVVDNALAESRTQHARRIHRAVS